MNHRVAIELNICLDFMHNKICLVGDCPLSARKPKIITLEGKDA